MSDQPAPETVTFHFHWAKRQDAIEVAQKLLAGVRERILPVFEEAYAADQRYVERLHLKLAEAKEDGANVSEEELQEALSLYDDTLEIDATPAHELTELANHLLLMALVGLFHQWERTIKRHFAEEFHRNGFAPEWRTKTLRADFSLLKKWIEVLEFPRSQVQVLDELQSLLLIVNVAKHGDGDACSKLSKKHPDYFWRAPDEPEREPQAERLRITPQLLDRYAAAIVAFWQHFPENGPVGVRTLREPELAQR